MRTEGFSKFEQGMLDDVRDKAEKLAKHDGDVLVRRGRRDTRSGEGEGAAITTWSITNLFARPRMTLFDPAFSDVPTLGITLTHELIHCRQGFWKVWWQNLVWAVLRRSGEPPIEEEASDAVNLWWDDGKR